jgi:two-component system NarL family response regulator
MSPEPKQPPLTVLVVEDHELPRYAVTGLLEDSGRMKVVAHAESGWQAVGLYRRHRPDVVIMDLRLPEMDGVSATAAICADDPAARVLVLSQYEGDEDIKRALAAGARGYLKKDVDGATLLEAVAAVARGDRYVARRIEDQIKENEARSELTKRELDVLRLICEGLSNQQIAETIGIAVGTTRIHVSNVLNKLGVSRRTEVVTVAIKRGLFRLPE